METSIDILNNYLNYRKKSYPILPKERKGEYTSFDITRYNLQIKRIEREIKILSLYDNEISETCNNCRYYDKLNNFCQSNKNSLYFTDEKYSCNHFKYNNNK